MSSTLIGRPSATARADAPLALFPLFYAAGAGLAGIALYLFTRPVYGSGAREPGRARRFDPIPLAFIGPALLSAAFSPAPKLAWGSVGVLLVMVVTYWLLIRQLPGDGLGERFVRYWVLGAVILAVVSLDGFLQNRTHAASMVIGKNGAGTLLATSLPLVQLYAAQGEDRPLSRLALWLVPGVLLLTMSLGAWIAAAASQLLLLACRNLRRVMAITAVIAAVMLVATVAFAAISGAPVRVLLESRLDPHGSSKVERIYIWKAASRMWLEHPLTGVGLGAFSYSYPSYKLPEASEPVVAFAHNLVMNTLAETGVLGLVGLGLLIATWYRRGARAARHGADAHLAWGCLAALTALLVHQLFDGTAWSLQTGLGLWLLGAVLSQLEGDASSRPATRRLTKTRRWG